MNRSIEVFNQAVQRTFGFLKSTARLDELYARSIPLSDDQGLLVPVCDLHADDEELIGTLARWREENSFAYPTQFPVTLKGTGEWLRRRLLDVEDRILFLVLTRLGRPIGHLGYANCCNERGIMEIDNVVRGIKSGCKGIMTRAMQAALDWAERELGPREIFLRVFNDNSRGVEFYRRLGFAEDRLLPLRRHIDGDAVIYRPVEAGDDAPADQQFLRMIWAPPRTTRSEQTILTAGPSISAREISYALDAVRSGWNDRWNRYITSFERAMADYVGVKYALTTSSCTGALHLSLLALGICRGDEVIVPDLTWVATANVVTYVGATPVFADIEAESLCVDPAAFEAAITKRTKAIIPVHLYGHPARMDRIMEIARKHGLKVVEDAAPAVGAEFKGRRVGSFGEFSCFSFQGAKVLVTGEGGMLLTNDEALYRRAHKIWDQGRIAGSFWIDEPGWKYKMSNVQAALGLGQLERIDELVERKRRIFDWYDEDLRDVPHVLLCREAPWARSIYWMTNIILGEGSPVSRDDLRTRLKERNVDTRPFFPAVSRYPLWPVRQKPGTISSRSADRGINLPSGVCLKREQVRYVSRCIRDILSPGA